MVLELKLRSYVNYECIKCMLLESYGYVDCGREDPDTVWAVRVPWGDGDTAVNQEGGARDWIRHISKVYSRSWDCMAVPQGHTPGRGSVRNTVDFRCIFNHLPRLLPFFESIHWPTILRMVINEILHQLFKSSKKHILRLIVLMIYLLALEPKTVRHFINQPTSLVSRI